MLDTLGVFLYTDLMIKSKHNNLLNYFLYDNKNLSKAYVKKCEKFFKELKTKKENKTERTYENTNKTNQRKIS